MVALYALETALGKACRERDASILEAEGFACHGPLQRLEIINAMLQQVTEQIEFKAICAFATFEHDSCYDAALEWGAHLETLLEEEPLLLQKARERALLEATRREMGMRGGAEGSEEEAEAPTLPADGEADAAVTASRIGFQHLRYDLFEGNMIRVKPADEPEVIQWENLEYTGNEQALRKIATNLVALLVLVFGFILVRSPPSSLVSFFRFIPGTKY